MKVNSNTTMETAERDRASSATRLKQGSMQGSWVMKVTRFPSGQRHFCGWTGCKVTLKTMGRDSAPNQMEDKLFMWPSEKPVGPLDFLSLHGMIIWVLKGNWRVELEDSLGTLGDPVPTAVKEPSRGNGSSASYRFSDQAICWTPVLILCSAAVVLARK